VKPGETKEWVIRFDQAQTLQMACLIPGHFEAGMKGQVIVQDKGSTAQSIQTTKPEKSRITRTITAAINIERYCGAVSLACAIVFPE
jgi:hypothetical protein